MTSLSQNADTVSYPIRILFNPSTDIDSYYSYDTRTRQKCFIRTGYSFQPSIRLNSIINPQYTVLHILSHCTSYSFYFIICSLFHSHLYLYIYSLVLCFIVLLLMLFLFSILLLLLLFLLHFPLSGPVLTYISLRIIPCMIVYVTNNK